MKLKNSLFDLNKLDNNVEKSTLTNKLTYPFSSSFVLDPNLYYSNNEFNYWIYYSKSFIFK